MKYTVIYRDNGDVLAVISEQPDIKSIKIDTFEIPDGNIIDSIDVSKKEHAAVSHATPMADFAKMKEELEATNKRLEELNRKRSEETEEMRKAILANATLMATIAPTEVGEEDEGL